MEAITGIEREELRKVLNPWLMEIFITPLRTAFARNMTHFPVGSAQWKTP